MMRIFQKTNRDVASCVVVCCCFCVAVAAVWLWVLLCHTGAPTTRVCWCVLVSVCGVWACCGYMLVLWALKVGVTRGGVVWPLPNPKENPDLKIGSYKAIPKRGKMVRLKPACRFAPVDVYTPGCCCSRRSGRTCRLYWALGCS